MSAICSCFCSGTATAATAAAAAASAASAAAAAAAAASTSADANAIFDKPILCSFQRRRCPVFIAAVSSEGAVQYKSFRMASALVVRASTVDSYENSSDFVKRMEQAWLISKQPRPVACSSCASKGYVECKWCGGTGFFVIGNNLLCEVPSRNTSCVICAGKGSACCSDCKGTGFRAKWLGKLPPL